MLPVSVNFVVGARPPQCGREGARSITVYSVGEALQGRREADAALRQAPASSVDLLYLLDPAPPLGSGLQRAIDSTRARMTAAFGSGPRIKARLKPTTTQPAKEIEG